MYPDGKYVVEVRANQIASEPQPYREFGFGDGIVGVIFNIAFVIGILWALFSTFYLVRTQNAKIIERFGKFTRVANAGLNVKIPFIDQIAGTMDLRVEELSETVTSKTSDNAFINVPVRIQFAVESSKVREAFYSLADADTQITSYVVNVVRSTVTGLTMEEVYKSKDKIEQDVLEALNKRFTEFGYKIENVLVDNPLPSEEVIAASNRVIASQREKEAAQNEADAIRIKIVGKAQAEAESLTLKAEAYVKQRTAIAEGMKGVFSEPEALAAYLVGIDWRDTVRDAAEKGSVIMVPTPTDGQDIAKIVAALKTAS